MKKRLMVLLVAVLTLLLSGIALAWWGDMWEGADVEKVKKFQKETLSLRDELITKRLELRKEFESEKPDWQRIAQLRKDIIDIQTKIQEIATKYDLPFDYGMKGGKKHRMRHGMMGGCGMGMMDGCGCR